jgi:AcrR family transcriptional regulator
VNKRRPYHHGDLRQALLTASVDLIRELGRSEFTLREVARRAGVSHAAPYRHFRDKSDLLAAVAEEGFERLTASIRIAADRGRQPFERLQNAGVAYVDFALKQPEHFSVMFSVDLRQDHASARVAAERCFAELVTLVAACRDERPGNGETTLTSARIAWSQVHGVAELALRGQLPFSSKKELRRFAILATETIGRGLGLNDRAPRS